MDKKTFELANNKRKIHNYSIHNKYECGMVLNSFQLKQIINSKININSSHGWVRGQEIFIRNLFSDQKDESKLLLHKAEICRIKDLIRVKKFQLIPTKIYLKNHKVKIEIALAKYNSKLVNKEKISKLKEKSWKALEMCE